MGTGQSSIFFWQRKAIIGSLTSRTLLVAFAHKSLSTTFLKEAQHGEALHRPENHRHNLQGAGGIVGVLTILVVLGICAASVLGGAAMGNLSREFSRNAGVTGLFGGALGGLVIGVVAIVYGGGLAITLYAVGEGVYLLLALEENTRATVALLQRQANPR